MKSFLVFMMLLVALPNFAQNRRLLLQNRVASAGGGATSAGLTNMFGTNIAPVDNGPMFARSGSFTVPDNVLLVVSTFISYGTGGSDGTTGSSMVGDGLTPTFTKRLTNSASIGGPYYAIHDVFTAPITTGGSMTCTWTNASKNWNATAHNTFFCMVVQAVTNYDSGSPIGGSVNGIALGVAAATITLSSTPATTSIVIASFGFADDFGGPTAASPGTGWTEDYDLDATLGWGGIQVQHRTGSTSTSVSWADTAVTASGWLESGLALEIKGSP